MKVIQVLPDLNGGGVERGTLEVAEALVHAGHESVVVSSGGAMVSELESQGSRHVQWNLGKKSPFTFLKFLQFRKWLLAERADILHVRSRMPAWVCWLAWRGMPKQQRPKLVTTVHGLYSVSGYSEVMCKGERVIAVSETVQAYIHDHYPKTDPNKVRLIYRGVDPDIFPYGYRPEQAWLDAWYESYPQTRDKKLITLPGRLTRLKGHNDFLDLIAELKRRKENVMGLIVGGEDPKRQAYAQSLKERVEAEELGDAVIFTGPRKDIKDIYAISDLVLSLSTKPESFGRTVLESLRLGIPTLGYSHGGVAEILAEMFPEGRVGTGDQVALIESVIQQLNDPSQPDNSQAFTRREMLDKTLSLYQELDHEHKTSVVS